jgi:hypothetical protein
MYAWSEALAYPYETTWSLLQKITLLNVVEPLVLLRDVCPTAIIVNQCYLDMERRDTFVDTEWMTVGPSRKAALPSISDSGNMLRNTLQSHGGQVYLNSLATHLLAQDLRICPACIALGFHCIAHQLEGVRVCPMHSIALTSACPACGRNLIRFAPNAWFKQFQCPHCKESLFHDEVPGPPDEAFKALIFARIQPLIAWINAFRGQAIAWPHLRADLPIRVVNVTPWETTTLSEGIIWALQKLSPSVEVQAYLGPEAAQLFLARAEGSDDLDTWGDSAHPATRVQTKKSVREMRKFVMGVVREEDEFVRRAIKGHEDCCQDFCSRLDPLEIMMGRHVVRPGSSYCGFAQTFYLWRESLERGLDELEISVRSGWHPKLDASFKEVVRRDLRSLFFLTAQLVAQEQSAPEDASNHGYRVFKIGTHPFFSLNGERSRRDSRGNYGPSSAIFYVSDEGVIHYLRCDAGRMIAEHRRRLAALSRGLVAFREQRLKEVRAQKEMKREKGL